MASPAPVVSEPPSDPHSGETAGLWEAFSSPPASHAPVPFYWWAGERLEKERLAWQLDQLVAQGVRQTVISYPHGPDGGNEPGDPPVFSPEWWELFRWFLGECRDRGMTVGFQDYTLVTPILEAIGRETPGMESGQMSCVHGLTTGRAAIHLAAEPGCPVIGAWAYPVQDGKVNLDRAQSVMANVSRGKLRWKASGGRWLVAMVFYRPKSFDPLHPEAGALAIDRLYAPFERECPGEPGGTLNLFFQDELDFGARMPFWSNHLPSAFEAATGRAMGAMLPALWLDLGSATEKFRIDFSDVVVRRMEACYFKPVFAWHDERGVLFGHDNCGRGRIAEGRAHYGDYFRAMRWYSAPGCDDPKLQGPRSFKGLKVNSSIAHLYNRPRVWIEAFHSSGWGTTPAEVVAAINEDFAFGATVVNLHGLYYSTRGGWWEWAPPDFHFRQPYWQHAGQLNTYLTRLSWLMSQGRHLCDVAMVYPIEALDILPAETADTGLVAHMGNEAACADGSGPTGPEETAFGLGKFLFDQGCDFDFIDFESIDRASAADGKLMAGPGSYRVLILPAMPAVRMSTLRKAREFARSGGLVLAYGCLPTASDLENRDDPALVEILEDIFGPARNARERIRSHPGDGMGCYLSRGFARALDIIQSGNRLGFTTTAPVQATRRDISGRQLLFVNNPTDHPVATEISVTHGGTAEIWDAWTGTRHPLPASPSCPIHLEPREAKLVLVDSSESPDAEAPPRTEPVPMAKPGPMVKPVWIDPADGWECEILPTLDNRHGDFTLPAEAVLLGPQARRFKTAEAFDDATDWTHPGFDDAGWSWATASFGPRLEFAGPFPPGARPDFDLSARKSPHLDKLAWQPYEFSTRWGIERDPFLTYWLSGPHGLKGAVPEEFLDFECGEPGSLWLVRGTVYSAETRSCPMVAGGRCAYRVYLNGKRVMDQANALPAGKHAPWNIPYYGSVPGSATVTLQAGANDLLVELIQPADQRTRAYVAFDPPSATPQDLALRWFTSPDRPRPCWPASADRRGIRFRFQAPPGAESMEILCRGEARAWADGHEMSMRKMETRPDGSHRYLARANRVNPAASVFALLVDAPVDSRGGDALPEPVRFHCRPGRIRSGDWSSEGLATYSGMVKYSTQFDWNSPNLAASLDLGQIKATARVELNGKTIATMVVPPWTCPLSPHLRRGKNHLSVTVANTLANHYSVGIPSPYAFAHQTPSGLIGPVRILPLPATKSP